MRQGGCGVFPRSMFEEHLFMFGISQNECLHVCAHTCACVSVCVYICDRETVGLYVTTSLVWLVLIIMIESY